MRHRHMTAAGAVLVLVRLVWLVLAGLALVHVAVVGPVQVAIVGVVHVVTVRKCDVAATLAVNVLVLGVDGVVGGGCHGVLLRIAWTQPLPATYAPSRAI
jgi:hypothetical protein